MSDYVFFNVLRLFRPISKKREIIFRHNKVCQIILTYEKTLKKKQYRIITPVEVIFIRVT